MVKAKKLILLSLSAALVLSIFISGCSATVTTTALATSPATTTATTPTTKAISPLSEQELQKLVADCSTVTKTAKTYKTDMSMKTTMNVDNKSKSAYVSMTIQGAIDTVQASTQMSVDIETTDDTGKKQSQVVDMYVLDGILYAKVNIPGQGDQWAKTTASQQILDSLGAEAINEQMAAFNTPDAIEYIKMEPIKGIDCYVLKITPNVQYLRDYAEKNVSQGLTINWDKVPDIKKLYKDMTYQIWIAKDTKYLQKLEANGTMEFTDDFAHSSELSFKTLKVGMNVAMEMYDYDVSIAILLPDAAKNAIEIAPEALLGK